MSTETAFVAADSAVNKHKRKRSQPGLMMDPGIELFIKVYRRVVILFDIVMFFFSVIAIYVSKLYRCFVPKSKRSVEGEIALVTGAANGLGRVLATELAKLGAIVVCADINEDGVNDTVDIVKASGGQAFGFQCDVTNCDQVEAMANRIRHEIGDVTILLNNAGVQVVKPFENQSRKQIERIINTNLYGQIWHVRAFLPRMIEMNKGSIVSMCALGGYAGFPNMLPFVASKFAMRGFMEGLYLELRLNHPKHDLHLMTVAPFIIDTGKRRGPIIRFPGLINVVSADRAARIIISSLRRRETVVFIPWVYYYIQNAIRILPLRVQLLLTDFIDTGVEIGYDHTDY